MITDFLKTERPEEELKTALEVLREFKECETNIEYNQISHVTWVKIEQLEEFLDHLVNGAELDDETKELIARYSNCEVE